MDNKFYREGFNNADGEINIALPRDQNYQGPAGFDFQVTDLVGKNREEFIKGFEDHVKEAFQGLTQIQLYFGVSN